jgi:hypothetical protein
LTTANNYFYNQVSNYEQWLSKDVNKAINLENRDALKELSTDKLQAIQ